MDYRRSEFSHESGGLPMPRAWMSSCIDRLGRAIYITTLDLSRGLAIASTEQGKIDTGRLLSLHGVFKLYPLD